MQFPITINRSAYERGTGWHGGKAPADVLAAFASVQPWAELEGPAPVVEEAFRWHPLAHLQRLSNIDKHRALHPALCGLDFMYAGLPEDAESEWALADPWPWSDGAVVARCVVRGLPSGRVPEFGDTFVVGLEEDAAPLRVPSVVGRLRGMPRHADYIFHLLSVSGY